MVRALEHDLLALPYNGESFGTRFVGLAYQGKDIMFRFIVEYIVA